MSDAPTLALVLHEVRAFIHRYVHLSREQATLIALWIAMTHAIEAFDYAAYLHITSPLAECGKTRVLELLEALVPHPWKTDRVTAAVLMRKVDTEHPTLLLDESDAAFNGNEEYGEALRGLLNAGFQRSGKASVCIGQGANLTYKDFSVFGPKAIAGIGRLPSTVESRSIPIVMKRKTKGETTQKWRARDGSADARPIRQQLTAVLTGKAPLDTLRLARPMMPDGLSDRTEDVLEPLFALADLAGLDDPLHEDWPTVARDAAVALMGATARAAREADQNLPLELLADIQQIFIDKGNPEIIATKTLLDGLVALDDRPWATFGKSDKPLTGHRLARLLKGFDIKPAGTIREGQETFKGYRRGAFEDAFARYLAPEASRASQPNKTGAESPKTEPSRAKPVTVAETAKTPQNASKNADCDDVPLSTPDHGDCCEGGPVQLRCKLCPKSPTYWQGRPN